MVPRSPREHAPLRALLYARVSSPPQKHRPAGQDDEPSLGEQLSLTRAAAAQRGWPVVAELEDVIPGAVPVSGRPAGAELYRLMGECAFDVLVVYDNDRIGRDQDGVVAKVFRSDLRRSSVQVFSVHQPLEPRPRAEYDPYEDDAALWLESVSDTASSVYIRQFRRRRAFGMKNRVSQKRLMPALPPIGYLAERHVLPSGRSYLGNRYPDPEFAPVVRRIYAECEAGHSCLAIARLLNADGFRTPSGTLWIESTVRGILKNPTYYGAAVYYRTRCIGGPDPKHPGRRSRVNLPPDQWLVAEEAQHPGLVTKEQWVRCQEIMAARRKAPRAYGESSLLAGLVRCGKCGGPMYKNGGWNGGYYSCHRFRSTMGAECAKNNMQRLPLETQVVEYLAGLRRSDDLLATFRLTPDNDEPVPAAPLERSEQALQEIDRRLLKAREAFEAGIDTLDEYRARKEELLRDRAEIDARRASAERLRNDAARRELSATRLAELIARFGDGFSELPLRMQKALLRLVVQHVEVADRRVNVVLRDDFLNPSDYARAIEIATLLQRERDSARQLSLFRAVNEIAMPTAMLGSVLSFNTVS